MDQGPGGGGDQREEDGLEERHGLLNLPGAAGREVFQEGRSPQPLAHAVGEHRAVSRVVSGGEKASGVGSVVAPMIGGAAVQTETLAERVQVGGREPGQRPHHFDMHRQIAGDVVRIVTHDQRTGSRDAVDAVLAFEDGASQPELISPLHGNDATV